MSQQWYHVFVPGDVKKKKARKMTGEQRPLSKEKELRLPVALGPPWSSQSQDRAGRGLTHTQTEQVRGMSLQGPLLRGPPQWKGWGRPSPSAWPSEWGLM